MADYPTGARLRVAFDVTVLDDNWWETTGHTRLTFGPTSRSEAVSVERLPDPEPDWQHGDIVRAADGQVYTCESRKDSGNIRPWRLVGLDPLADPWYRADELPRPLVPLVRGGKPWGES